MENRVLLLGDYCKLEWHWFFIRNGRKKINQLSSKGYELFSEEMIKLSEKLNYHCNKAYLLEKKLKE